MGKAGEKQGFTRMARIGANLTEGNGGNEALERFHQCCSAALDVQGTAVFLALGFVLAQ